MNVHEYVHVVRGYLEDRNLQFISYKKSNAILAINGYKTLGPGLHTDRYNLSIGISFNLDNKYSFE